MFVVGYAITYSGFSSAAANPKATELDMELFFTFCSPNVVLMTAAVFILLQKVPLQVPIMALLIFIISWAFTWFMYRILGERAKWIMG